MWLQLKDLAGSKQFALVLVVLNGYVCAQSIYNGSWFWAALSGFFVALSMDRYANTQ